MTFFLNKSEQTRFASGAVINQGLWRCQEGALLAAYSHFTASDNPAVISLPTGSGKTELMIGICFMLKAQRVLVVEPATFLRNQTADRFANMKVFRRKELSRRILIVPMCFPSNIRERVMIFGVISGHANISTCVIAA